MTATRKKHDHVHVHVTFFVVLGMVCMLCVTSGCRSSFYSTQEKIKVLAEGISSLAEGEDPLSKCNSRLEVQDGLFLKQVCVCVRVSGWCICLCLSLSCVSLCVSFVFSVKWREARGRRLARCFFPAYPHEPCRPLTQILAPRLKMCQKKQEE